MTPSNSKKKSPQERHLQKTLKGRTPKVSSTVRPPQDPEDPTTKVDLDETQEPVPEKISLEVGEAT